MKIRFTDFSLKYSKEIETHEGTILTSFIEFSKIRGIFEKKAFKERMELIALYIQEKLKGIEAILKVHTKQMI